MRPGFNATFSNANLELILPIDSICISYQFILHFISKSFNPFSLKMLTSKVKLFFSLTCLLNLIFLVRGTVINGQHFKSHHKNDSMAVLNEFNSGSKIGNKLIYCGSLCLSDSGLVFGDVNSSYFLTKSIRQKEKRNSF